jgi:hypothetical protein
MYCVAAFALRDAMCQQWPRPLAGMLADGVLACHLRLHHDVDGSCAKIGIIFCAMTCEAQSVWHTVHIEALSRQAVEGRRRSMLPKVLPGSQYECTVRPHQLTHQAGVGSTGQRRCWRVAGSASLVLEPSACSRACGACRQLFPRMSRGTHGLDLDHATAAGRRASLTSRLHHNIPASPETRWYGRGYRPKAASDISAVPRGTRPVAHDSARSARSATNVAAACKAL